MPKKEKPYRNVWERLDDSIHETNVETTQTRFRKWMVYIVLIALGACAVGLLIGHFLK